MSFPGGSDGKESARNAGDLGLIPELERSPGGGHGNPLQCSCLENFMDRGAWRATVCGAAESDTAERLSTLSTALTSVVSMSCGVPVVVSQLILLTPFFFSF